jgi:hypothetical protein
MDALYEQLGFESYLARAKALFATDDEEAREEIEGIFTQIDAMLATPRGWFKTNTHILTVDLTMHAYFRLGGVDTLEVQYACQAVAQLLDALRFIVPNASPKLLEQAQERLALVEGYLCDGEEEIAHRDEKPGDVSEGVGQTVSSEVGTETV